MTKLEAPVLHSRLAERFGPDVVTAFDEKALQPFAVVAADRIAEVAGFLKAEPDLAFDNLMCLSGVDWPKETPPRLEVVYHLFSYTHLHSFVLKVHLPRDGARLPTCEGVWGVANWHEREAFDMFGIVFSGHSDLRRILLPDDWHGHPLRKDWVDPEFYNGMRVKPTMQMAERALGGEALGVGPFDTTPPNRHVDE
jgi:NADH-quinone oxidoreductase subunit C